MHAWIKLACVVLAWTILPAGVVTAGPGRPAHPVQVSTRTTNVSLTSFRTAELAPVTAASTVSAPVTEASVNAVPARARTYVVQRGDSLSGIAARFGVPGGWPALYGANRARIGADPNTLNVGTVLHLPGVATPVRYTVTAGDTLSGIAARFGVPGGWPALYGANRARIGPDPATIHAGTRLTIPSPAGASPASSSPAPGRPAPGRPQPHTQPTGPAPAQSAPPTAHQVPPQPATARPHASTGMPSWLKTMLLAVGLLAVVIFAAEPLLVARRRRRRRTALHTAPPHQAASRYQADTPPAHQFSQAPPVSPAPEATPMPSSTHPTRIVVADHDRLVITRSKRDDIICVLRPPGESPADILRVARLVLPEGQYGTLAEQLGVSANWPMNE